LTKLDSRRSIREERRGESRLPAVVAVLFAAALYVGLPNELLVGPRYVVPVLELVLIIPLIAINPSHFTRETKFSRIVSLMLVLVIALANLGTLGFLVSEMLNGEAKDGKQLLLAAFQIWLTNIIVFGLAYWELDRGGPVKRTQLSRDALPPADFRFSQDENHGAVREVAMKSSIKADWVPTLVDYLYVSTTNSTAFSPTDTMPLTSRAKTLMAVQSIAALVTSLLVIARAVSAIQ
jgi:hypothetical protein